MFDLHSILHPGTNDSVVGYRVIMKDGLPKFNRYFVSRRIIFASSDRVGYLLLG